jgi:hypothetical protein
MVSYKKVQIDQSPVFCIIPEHIFEHFPPAMKTGTHCADGTIKKIRNFFVGQPLDIAQDDDRAEIFGK